MTLLLEQMNSVESAYRHGALQISNIIRQLKFAPYVVTLFLLGRFEKLFVMPY